MAQKTSFIPGPIIEEDFLKSAGLENLSDSEKESLIIKLIESVKNRVIIRIDDLITENDKSEFYELLDQGDNEKINHFLEQKNINVAQLVAEEALLQKIQLLDKLAQLKEGK